jgi:multisubunit Na+/H+ antiporter MnhE subunit
LIKPFQLSFFDLMVSYIPSGGVLLLHHQITIKQNNMKKIVFALEVFVMMTLFIWSALMQMMH